MEICTLANEPQSFISREVRKRYANLLFVFLMHRLLIDSRGSLGSLVLLHLRTMERKLRPWSFGEKYVNERDSYLYEKLPLL
jgi:hypothetical protein